MNELNAWTDFVSTPVLKELGKRAFFGLRIQLDIDGLMPWAGTRIGAGQLDVSFPQGSKPELSQGQRPSKYSMAKLPTKKRWPPHSNFYTTSKVLSTDLTAKSIISKSK